MIERNNPTIIRKGIYLLECTYVGIPTCMYELCLFYDSSNEFIALRDISIDTIKSLHPWRIFTIENDIEIQWDADDYRIDVNIDIKPPINFDRNKAISAATNPMYLEGLKGISSKINTKDELFNELRELDELRELMFSAVRIKPLKVDRESVQKRMVTIWQAMEAITKVYYRKHFSLDHEIPSALDIIRTIKQKNPSKGITN